MTTTPVILTTTSERHSIARDSDALVTVTLTNMSPDPLWVNKRMGLGYADDAERELCATIRAADGSIVLVPKSERADVHRMPLEHADFVKLAGGDSTTMTVNLAIWHPFRQPGRFQVVFIYENRTHGKAFDVEAFVGKVRADPLWLEVE